MLIFEIPSILRDTVFNKIASCESCSTPAPPTYLSKQHKGRGRSVDAHPAFARVPFLPNSATHGVEDPAVPWPGRFPVNHLPGVYRMANVDRRLRRSPLVVHPRSRVNQKDPIPGSSYTIASQPLIDSIAPEHSTPHNLSLRDGLPTSIGTLITLPRDRVKFTSSIEVCARVVAFNFCEALFKYCQAGWIDWEDKFADVHRDTEPSIATAEIILSLYQEPEPCLSLIMAASLCN